MPLSPANPGSVTGASHPDDQAGAAMVLQAIGLAVQAGQRIVQSGLDFAVRRGEVLAIVGPSGCGKSTLLRHLVGLQVPAAGRVRLLGRDLHEGNEDELAALRRRSGVMFQAGALWSSMTLGENLMLPMRMFSRGTPADFEARARERLARVGLAHAYSLRPSELSGGMRKRAALARALALDPELLFLDEPGSGLDPLNVARLDELVLRLRQDLGTTVVMVTHEVSSILAVADRVLYLDDQTHTMIALGPPQALLADGPATVRRFLARRDGGLAGPAKGAS
jgi:phospholipid/cholesterol/gamma-HCH transport system ATP-binding protein